MANAVTVIWLSPVCSGTRVFQVVVPVAMPLPPRALTQVTLVMPEAWEAVPRIIAAGLAAVPVRVLVGLDDTAARAVALTENLARRDLTAWEEAAAVALLREARRDAGLPTDVRALAGAAGRSRTVTAELLRVADTLTPAVVEEARRLAGGTFVRTPDTLPHRDLATAARLEAPADRARALALLAGEMPGRLPGGTWRGR